MEVESRAIAPQAGDEGQQGPKVRRHKHQKGRRKESQGKGPKRSRLKRMRDIRRELQQHPDMAATVRQELELELDSLQTTRREKNYSMRRRAMISRYHMVRFFERKKAQRRLKQFRKAHEMTEDPEAKSKIKKDIHNSEVDVAYTHYFPHLEPYVSIWPNEKGTKSSQANGHQDIPTPTMHDKDKDILEGDKRPEIWQEIEEAMGEGTAALERIRDRRDVLDFHAKPLAFRASQRPSKSQEKPHKDKGKKSGEIGGSGKFTSSSKLQAGGKQLEKAKDAIAMDEDDSDGFFE